jgi:hypothetical protein
MRRNHNILEPPDDMPEPERRRWLASAKFHNTLWQGEDFWKSVHKEDRRGLYDNARRKRERKKKLKAFGKSVVGRDLVCHVCDREAMLVSDDNGGICQGCYSDALNRDEEDFWTSIGCPD